MVLGDLEEQLPTFGRRWYWREAVAISAHALLRRPGSPADPRRSGDSFMYSAINDVRSAGFDVQRVELQPETILLSS